MNCPECTGGNITAEYCEGLGTVHVCVECDATWISENGVIDRQTIASGEGRRALQRQIDYNDFTRAFNDPEGWGL